MRQATGAAAHPLVAHLQQVKALEQDRFTSADAAYTQARATIEAARLQLTEAERGFAEAERARLVAAERLSAVTETIAGAAPYLFGEAVENEPDTEASAAEPEGPTRPDTSSTGRGPEDPESVSAEAKPRPVTQLILDALADGKETALAVVTARVRQHRPHTAGKVIRSTASTLRKGGKVEFVRRGVYRLVIPGDTHA
ncbi:hypothetical protein [Streptomyces sp. WM6378]|uniref:hypothetical protein n=1 Tax=Streptomyces sp. WM6378 TaxID=1415557 RepID=UPI0006AE917D|nr:hypothetical protein [Streptomyces sp. WM6378]KOU40668.1 hypothetical protein ADK54_21465 [Streptomyces sp. WM6378]